MDHLIFAFFLVMSVTLQNYHRLHDDTELSNHLTGSSWTLQAKDRRMPRPSPRLICSLWAFCIALLFIIILILIVTVTGQTEQNIEVGLRNLSLGMHSRVERLSQEDYRTLEKLNDIETSMKDLKGSLSRDSQKILEEVDNLTEELQKGINSKMSTMEALLKNLKGQWLNDIKQNLETKLRNLNTEINSLIGQLSENDSRIMEKLCAMENSMKDLKAQRLQQLEQNMTVKLRNLSMDIHSRVDQLSQGDSRMMETLSTVEISMKNLTDSRMMEKLSTMETAMRTITGSLEEMMKKVIEEDSRMMETLFTVENSMKNFTDSRMMEKLSTMENSLKNLTDSRMMEKLSTMENSMKNLTGQRMEKMEQSMDIKFMNLSLGMNSVVQMLSKHDSKVTDKLSALEISIRDLKGPLSKDLPNVVGAVGKQTEEIQKLKASTVLAKVTAIESSVDRILSDDVKGSLSREIQKVLGSVNKLAEEIQKGKGSKELCATSWMTFGGSCYFWSSNMRSWNVAKRECEDQKAHLVVINGNDEMIFLRAFSQKKMWWIGLIEKEDAWEWVDGTSYEITAKFWQPGQPDDYVNRGLQGGEDCAQLRDADGWNDAHCSSKHLYICEKKIS